MENFEAVFLRKLQFFRVLPVCIICINMQNMHAYMHNMHMHMHMHIMHIYNNKEIFFLDFFRKYTC